jgi:hypothetical protein
MVERALPATSLVVNGRTRLALHGGALVVRERPHATFRERLNIKCHAAPVSAIEKLLSVEPILANGRKIARQNVQLARANGSHHSLSLAQHQRSQMAFRSASQCTNIRSCARGRNREMPCAPPAPSQAQAYSCQGRSVFRLTCPPETPPF